MVDSVHRTRSLGVPAEGVRDQYADGIAAKVWEHYIGGKSRRTDQYRAWLCNLLTDTNCHDLLDVACGTGVDSIMLLDSGFNVTSSDASDKMLKYALKERWSRRKESAYDQWVIEEANWLTLENDLMATEVGNQMFDAVLCMGNSFAHLPDPHGDLHNQKTALKNFAAMVRPGGILVIDHRNYDAILDTGRVPAKNVYYNSQFISDIKCSNLYTDGHPTMVTLDYTLDISADTIGIDGSDIKQENTIYLEGQHSFRLSYYPHRLDAFKNLLLDVFGAESTHTVYSDFKPCAGDDCPAYFIHVVQKPF